MSGGIFSYIWLIPLLPGLGALVIGLLGRKFLPKHVVSLIACGTVFVSLVISVAAVWELRQIPVIGEKMLGHMEFMRPLMPIIRHHRERMDGHGYPDGLRGDKIPFLARVLAIADAYDAMTSERPYRRALSPDEAMSEIERESGLQFDEEMAKIFMSRVLGSLS